MSGQINYSVERLEADRDERGHIRQQLLQLKDEYAIRGKTVIEFGCGFGHNLELFAADNVVSGLEGLGSAVERARQNGLDVTACDLNAPVDRADASADIVLCIDVLEHLVEPQTALAEMHRVLRPGGLALLNVPNHFDLAGRVKILAGRQLDTHGYFPDHDEWDNPHIRFFTHDGFIRFVRSAGFRIVEDRSAHVTSFPFQARLNGRLKTLRSRMAARFPALFAAGHFLVAQKAG